MEMLDFLKTILIVQLFYAFGITLLAYAIGYGGGATNALDQVTAFSDVADSYNFPGMASKVQSSLIKNTNMPIIELGALVFYSGNILIDLLLNFAFAIPQMLGLVVNGVQRLFAINGQLFAIVELFASVGVIIMYFVGIIQLLTTIKTGKVV